MSRLIICGIPNPNIPRNTICQTKILLWNLQTPTLIFSKHPPYLAHIQFFPPLSVPYISLLSLLFPIFHRCHALSWQPVGLLPRTQHAHRHACWCFETLPDTTGGAVAVRRRSDWTAPQRRRKTNHSQLASLASEHVTDYPVLNTWAVKKKKK